MSLAFLRLHDIITDWYWRMVDRRLMDVSVANSQLPPQSLNELTSTWLRRDRSRRFHTPACTWWYSIGRHSHVSEVDQADPSHARYAAIGV
jgi:hypothetical protein